MTRANIMAIGAVLLLAGPVRAEGLLHAALGAPDALSVSGGIAVHFEALGGQYRASGPAADSALMLQTRVAAEFGAGRFRLGGELIDARAYGQAAASTLGPNEINALELVQLQAVYQAGRPAGAGAGVRVLAGRFAQDFLSRRLIGRAAFRQTPNVFTGLRLDWHGTGSSPVALSALIALPVTRLPCDPAGVRDNRVVWDRESFDRQVAALGWTQPLGGTTLQLEAMRYVERDAPGFPTTDRRIWSPGVRLFHPPAVGQFDHDVELIHQWGRVSDGLAPAARQRRLSAWLVHAEIGRRLDLPWRPHLSAGIDLVSGAGSDPGVSHRYEPVFAARRFELGGANLYNAVNGGTNLISPMLRIEAVPSPRFEAAMDYRPVWLSSLTDSFALSGVRDPDGRAGRFVGHQVEARARWWAVPHRVHVDTVATLLAHGRFLRDAPNARREGDTLYGALDIGLEF